jgi:hypothetical protein
MKLDDAQKAKVSEWIAAGCKLAEIQNRLMAELGIKLTYMEVRFLVDDLKLVPKDPEPVKPVVLAPPEKSNPATAQAAAPMAAGTPMRKGEPVADEQALPGVSVSVDQVTRPGALVSGKVTFSDNGQADWYLDQMGRLGVVPKVQGYKPDPADVQEFQIALQNELAKLGY